MKDCSIGNYNIETLQKNEKYEKCCFVRISVKGEQLMGSTFEHCLFIDCRIFMSSGASLLNGTFRFCMFENCLFYFCVNDTTTLTDCFIVEGKILSDLNRFALCMLRNTTHTLKAKL